MVGPLEVLHDRSPDVAFAEADHVGYKYTAIIANDLLGLLYGHPLEARQLSRDLVIPQKVFVLLVF